MITHTIINGDNRNMVDVADNQIGLIVTSPPYWDVINYSQSSRQIGRKCSLTYYLDQLGVTFEQCHRVLYPGGRMCVVIRDITKNGKTYLLHADIAKVAESKGFVLEEMKTILLLALSMYDYLLIFKKKGNASFLPFDDKYLLPIWDLRANSKENDTDHPAPFKREIPRILIKNLNPENGTVLDPFLGSGTTMAAARDCDCDSIGYEIEEKYINMILRNVRAEQTTFSDLHRIQVIKNGTVMYDIER